MNINDFDFNLPEELIALYPETKRDHSNLLVVDRKSGSIKKYRFFDIIDFFNEQDALILNNSKVINCLLEGRKSTGGIFKFLAFEQIDNYSWKVIVNKSKRCNNDDVFYFKNDLTGVIVRDYGEGAKLLRFHRPLTPTEIDKLGKTPLPPYIASKRPIECEDKIRYQTVYSKEYGSVACPTAGLHFSENLINEISKKNVFIKYITLHVGLGTFKPVSVYNIEDHKMDYEHFILDENIASIINDVKKTKGKIFSVGTTSTRVLETCFSNGAGILPKSGMTDLYIYPGFNFKVVDHLITNFHTPKSTPYILTCAFGGKELIEEAYKFAIQEKFRFYSYGDSMLVI